MFVQKPYPHFFIQSLCQEDQAELLGNVWVHNCDHSRCRVPDANITWIHLSNLQNPEVDYCGLKRILPNFSFIHYWNPWLSDAIEWNDAMRKMRVLRPGERMTTRAQRLRCCIYMQLGTMHGKLYINVEWCWYFLRIWMLLLLLRSCGKTSQADSWNPARFGTTLNRSVGVSGKQQSVLSPVAKAWHCNHCNCCGTKTLVCWTGGATPEINDVSFSFCYVTMSIQNSIFFWRGRVIPRIPNEVWKADEKRIEHPWTFGTNWNWPFFPVEFCHGISMKHMKPSHLATQIWEWRRKTCCERRLGRVGSDVWRIFGGVSWPPNSCYVVSLQLESLMVTSETFKNCGERGVWYLTHTLSTSIELGLLRCSGRRQWQS